MHWLINSLPEMLMAIVAGGGLAALIGWRKPQAEADKIKVESDKIKAETEELVWSHMKETIERLRSDVDDLKAGRDNRDKEIAILKKANAACVEREKELVRRIAKLESQLGQFSGA